MKYNKILKVCLKGVFSLTPISSFFLTMWNEIESQFIEQRLKELEVEFAKLNERINLVFTKEMSRNENLYWFYKKVLDRFIKENRRQKRELYGNLLVNCILNGKFTNSELDMFEKMLLILDSLTLGEIIILYKLSDVKRFDSQEEESSFLDNLCKETKLTMNKLRNIVKCLESQFLLESFSPIIDGQPDEDGLTSARVYTDTEKYITDLGVVVLKSFSSENNLLENLTI